MPDHRVVGATPDAWRHLHWVEEIDGVSTELPAETYGELPPLRTAAR